MPHGKTRTFYRTGCMTFRCDECHKTYSSKYARDLHTRCTHPNSEILVQETRTCGYCNLPMSRGRSGVPGYCKCQHQ